MPAKKAAAPKSKLVWHVYRFDERYELPEDMRACRKSGLHFTRDYVGIAAGDEAVGYHNQFAIISNGDGLESCLLFGLYRKIVNFAAAHSRAKRGYLIGPAGDPLTEPELGRMLNIKTRQLRPLLAKFSKVKLLEQVPLPKFDLAENDDPADLRNSPEKSGKLQSSLKKGKRKVKGKVKGKGKGKAPNGKAAAPVAKEKKKGIVNQVTAPETNRSQTKPPKPPVADAGADRGRIIPIDPPCSDKAARGRPMGPTGRPGGSYSRSDLIFGQRVYEALGIGHCPGSVAEYREISSFASVWHRAVCDLGAAAEACDDLGMRLIVEARRIGRRGDRNRNKGAVWCDLAAKITAKRIREA
jgi:hypothetical protein